MSTAATRAQTVIRWRHQQASVNRAYAHSQLTGNEWTARTTQLASIYEVTIAGIKKLRSL